MEVDSLRASRSARNEHNFELTKRTNYAASPSRKINSLRKNYEHNFELTKRTNYATNPSRKIKSLRNKEKV